MELRYKFDESNYDYDFENCPKIPFYALTARKPKKEGASFKYDSIVCGPTTLDCPVDLRYTTTVAIAAAEKLRKQLAACPAGVASSYVSTESSTRDKSKQESKPHSSVQFSTSQQQFTDIEVDNTAADNTQFGSQYLDQNYARGFFDQGGMPTEDMQQMMSGSQPMPGTQMMQPSGSQTMLGPQQMSGSQMMQGSGSQMMLASQTMPGPQPCRCQNNPASNTMAEPQMPGSQTSEPEPMEPMRNSKMMPASQTSGSQPLSGSQTSGSQPIRSSKTMPVSQTSGSQSMRNSKMMANSQVSGPQTSRCSVPTQNESMKMNGGSQMSQPPLACPPCPPQGSPMQRRNSKSKPDPPFMNGLTLPPKPLPDFPPRPCPPQMHILQQPTPPEAPSRPSITPQERVISMSLTVEGQPPKGMAFESLPCGCRGTNNGQKESTSNLNKTGSSSNGEAKNCCGKK